MQIQHDRCLDLKSTKDKIYYDSFGPGELLQVESIW